MPAISGKYEESGLLLVGVGSLGLHGASYDGGRTMAYKEGRVKARVGEREGEDAVGCEKLPD